MDSLRVKKDLAAVAEDMGDGMAVCSSHPYKNNLGGICGFCLQEKLGKLVSSSFPVLNNPPSSSSSSPVSFASDLGSSAHTKTPYSRPPNPADDGGDRRVRMNFLLARRRKKKLPAGGTSEAVLKRSKSSAGPQRHFLGAAGVNGSEYGYSPGTRRAGGSGGGGGFWSFLHLSTSSSSSSKSAASRKAEKLSSVMAGGDSKLDTLSVFEESPGVKGGQFPASFERKVSRSRSVGCGSRSFSGDFFERISTGFGDCTLRRVESHREGHNSHRNSKQSQSAEKIYKCGGIFGGFTMITASGNSEDHRTHHLAGGKSPATANGGHARARSWNWAFASPMRAFSKPSREGKREVNIIRDGSGKNSGGPDLSAIPSLLTVGG